MGFFTRTAMDMLMKTTHPEINRRQCWNLHPHRKPCTECKDICPYGEQIFTRPNLVKDWDPCTECGLCVSACRSGCIIPSPEQVQRDTSAADTDNDTIWIGCEKSTRKNSMVRTCIAALTWETLAYLALNKKIVLDLTPCGECENDLCAAQLRKELTRLVDFFGQPMFEARFTLAYEPDEALYHVKELSRREMFEQVSHGSKSGTKKLLQMLPGLHSEDDGGVDFRLLLHQRTKQLKAAMDTPLLIAVDEEGGAVARLANHPAFDLPQYESAAAVGASGDPADACAMGQTIGAYLKEYGFNMDFAPDADVNTNPDNPIIGTRAFSSDAATAAEMAAAAADGLRTSGILPTLKHFPGHGDTAEDSHTALAVTYKTLDELQACELLPFAEDTGLHAVMVGHIAAPNVTGDGTPATLSPQLVALIPDAENTLIVTDSLAMDAITAAYTPGEAAVQALQAGCDVLLMPNSLPEAYAAVLEAVQNGTISEERLDRSVNKILLYKQQFAS